MLERMIHPSRKVQIAVVGKYIQLTDAYKSMYEALKHAGAALNCDVEITRVDAEDIEKRWRGEIYLKDVARRSRTRASFGNRGIEAKILAAQYTMREK